MSILKTKISLRILIAFVLSLGILSLPFLIIGLQYNCTGQDVFPKFFDSPFIFKSTSLATSLAYDYYTLGMIGNCLVWGGFFVTLNYFIIGALKKIDKSFLKVIYQWIIGILLVLTVMSIYLEISVCSQSISWEANLNKEAKYWGMTCKGEIVFMK